MLFRSGLGAILVAANPDGVVAMHARQLRGLTESLLAKTGAVPVDRTAMSAPAPAPEPELRR